MILESSGIVGAGGVGFGDEAAEPKLSAIVPDVDGPAGSIFVEMNADIT